MSKPKAKLKSKLKPKSKAKAKAKAIVSALLRRPVIKPKPIRLTLEEMALKLVAVLTKEMVSYGKDWAARIPAHEKRGE